MNLGSKMATGDALGLRLLFDTLLLLKRSSVVGFEHWSAIFERPWFAGWADPWAVEAVNPVSSVPKAQDH